MSATQNEPFVPLSNATPPAPGQSAHDADTYSVTVISQASGAQSFKPLSVGEEIHTAHSSKATSHGACAASHDSTPRVSIQREGDHVTGIRIHCGCGQVIDLACVY